MPDPPDTIFRISARRRLYPAARRIATSPTSCGISCAATAIAVLMPSGTEVRTAVQMIAPSMKL